MNKIAWQKRRPNPERGQAKDTDKNLELDNETSLNIIYKQCYDEKC